MKSTAVFGSIALVACGALVACVINNTPPADPTTTAAPTATATATASATASASASATATATATATASATASAPSGPAEPGSPAAYQACTADADCVAVPPVGCCQNGRMIAVAKTQADAYKASYTCPPPRPMCPMNMILETRVPECSATTHLCEMIAPEKIACGAQHKCPDGYTCKTASGASAGACTK